jgi:Zn-dependent M16 (insulinase) family peptidase
VNAVGVLLTYIAGSSISVLENTLVEKEQLASAVYYSWEARPNTVISFSLSSVDAGKLSDVEARFFEILKETANAELDMVYMQDCIMREVRKLKATAESSRRFYTGSVIQSFLFGDNSTLRKLADLHEFETLAKWTDPQWRQFLKKWFSDAPHISILGKPSAELAESLKLDEEARVASQKKMLGEAGLKNLAEKLAAAKAENDREIPKGTLEKFKVPDTSSISFINTTTARSGAARRETTDHANPIQKVIDNDASNLPLFIHFEHIQSNFVQINILVGTEPIPMPLRPLLAIYLDNFFNSPITHDGKRVEFEQVVMELERDTVDYNIDAGSSLGNPEMLHIMIRVEVEKYATAIKWARDMLWNSIFDVTRIQAATAKLLADVPEEKRDGSSMSQSAAMMTNNAPDSIGRARDTLVKALYLKRVKKILQTNPDRIIDQLEEIRKAICRPSNFRVLVIADVEKLTEPVSSWEILSERHDTSLPLAPIDRRLSRLSDAGKQPGNLAYIIPLPIDSSFAHIVGKGPEDLQEPQIPALMVAIAYLDAVEGPLWTAVRGTGLAYGTGFNLAVNSGHVVYQIYRSPDVYKAFVASREVLESFISGATAFDSLAQEGAISSIVLDIANEQATMSAAATDSFVRQVIRGLPNKWNDIILKRVRNVTEEEIRHVMKSVLLPVFMGDTASIFVTCAPIMVTVCHISNAYRDWC